ncbi:MAG: GDP-mannose 4,6-dehydratase [candidate division Zixibacteria bacterium]|nr:GDP-mannose 4,6-dehydratase [candidate division Zixibacteria bacterium]
MADFLVEKGFEVYATVYNDTRNVEHLKDKIRLLWCDIRDKERIESIILKVKPDYVFHFAAQSLVIPSWQDPERTICTNTLGTFYLLEAIREANIDPKIEVACSSAEYGLNFEHEIPVRETKEFRPSSPYGVSKIGTDMLCYLYWQAYGMKIIRIRPFNITGPRKRFDACSDFAQGIAAIESGLQEYLEVGSLDTIRDITDFRDGIKAIWLLVERGIPGEVYNICCGKGYKMGEVLEKFIALSTKPIEFRQVPEKMRLLDDPIFIGDNTKLCNLGWGVGISLEETLIDVLGYWRKETQRD